MEIVNAQYKKRLNIDGTPKEDNSVVQATIDGEAMTVPLDPGNRHYAEIQRQVSAGTLTIEDAD